MAQPGPTDIQVTGSSSNGSPQVGSSFSYTFQVKNNGPLPAADVVILGDVVEHMTRDEGRAVWDRSVAAARHAVYLSIPIVHYPQHDIEGNPFEVHVEEDWSHDDVLTTFDCIGARLRGEVVGVYECRTG